ncbi:hypothetical protein POSPLADRAFT_1039014 [Postia placenta MAD-698-R-SB12]|uniref:Heat shock protein 30 n=1 Tax=Postia placenta MAD-698-R-SB12 TaxID=670580 RepID=A0A1X6N9E4_9APHY|nr:hypothetical protein POSPLADRAFT_1039014 [Postia placenta MAD-698-R-SB12]OSX65269.1 hypothetical protein POSPLADRAFT_1039014 [Postia placenta MAD-698-R-SB12]
MTNRALDLNPPNATLHITTNASDWLWAAFAVMAFSLCCMILLDFLQPRGARLFHQIAIVSLATFTIGYFSMASDLGATPIAVEFRGRGSDPTRQIWYVRYIQWIITGPLGLLEVLLITGLSPSDILTTLFMSVVTVVCGLVGALVHSTYKWGYYVFGCAALFYIWYSLLLQGSTSTFRAGGVLRTGYLRSAGFLAFMLITYPICWACSEGGNVISNSSEMIWYGILDILAGPIFLFLFVFHLRNVDVSTLGLSTWRYTETKAETKTENSA